MRLARNKTYRIIIIVLILASFTPASLISKSAESAVVDSQIILPGDNKSSIRELNEEKICRTLENKIVVEKLRSYGLSKEEVTAKISRMSDEQIHQLAVLSDRIPAGGDGAVGLVVGVLVIVLLVLVIIYLAKRV
jgi:hypothetical protein